MKKSTFLGSVVSVLLAFSVITYARDFAQQQDPRSVQQITPTTNIQPNSTTEVTKPEITATQPSKSRSTVAPTTGVVPIMSTESVAENFVVPAQSYTATAYSLRGRTSSGKPVARGLIAADPRFLPIGTRVRVDAGAWSGEYVVADTGGSVKGRRIDIWTPTAGEALRFGRRLVKLTVVELGGKRAKNSPVRPRLVNSSNLNLPIEASKQER